jgi:hypothetical protein
MPASRLDHLDVVAPLAGQHSTRPALLGIVVMFSNVSERTSTSELPPTGRKSGCRSHIHLLHPLAEILLPIFRYGCDLHHPPQ